MESKNLSERSITELAEKKISLKKILGAFMGILSVFAIMIILLFIQKQYTVALPLLVVLFSLSSVLFFSKKHLSDVETEMGKREHDEMI